MAKKKNKSKKSAKPAEPVEETNEVEEVEDEQSVDDDGEDEAEAASSPEPDVHQHAAAEHGGHHAPNRKEYWRIFGLLAALTALEVGTAYLENTIGKTALVTALVGLALAKAGIVAIFFMHLKHETKVMKWTVMIPMAFPALYAFILIAEGMYRHLWSGV